MDERNVSLLGLIWQSYRDAKELGSHLESVFDSAPITDRGMSKWHTRSHTEIRLVESGRTVGLVFDIDLFKFGRREAYRLISAARRLRTVLYDLEKECALEPAESAVLDLLKRVERYRDEARSS